jgi:hypothetical protein
MKFLEKAQAAAPAFAAVGTSSQGLTVAKTRSALGGSAEINAMFQLLREYQFPRDEGKVDLTNLYKELHTFDDEGSSASGHCAAMREQTVAAPYDVGPGPTYTCLGDDVTGPGYRNGFALKVAGTTTSALLAFRWAPDATQQRSLGQIQGSFDTASQDVSFILVNLVEYPAGSTMGGATGNGFTVRTDLTGNAGTHRFTLRALVAGTDGANWTSLLGSGVSRGSGEHFLFKTSVASMMPGQAPKYFCLPSSIDEAGLQALDGQGASSVPSDCAHLSAAVEALSFLTLANAPVKASDFTGSDVGVGPAAP